MKRQRSQEEKPALDLVEEAVHLLRHGPTVGLAAYYVGSLPFVLALLYFWSDMAHSAFASERLTVGSLALTVLFFWMKTWQGAATQHWLAQASGSPPPPWGGGRTAKNAGRPAPHSKPPRPPSRHSAHRSILTADLSGDARTLRLGIRVLYERNRLQRRSGG